MAEDEHESSLQMSSIYSKSGFVKIKSFKNGVSHFGNSTPSKASALVIFLKQTQKKLSIKVLSKLDCRKTRF